MNTTKKEYPSWQTERYNFENNRVLQIDSKDQARNIEYKYLIKNEHVSILILIYSAAYYIFFLIYTACIFILNR